MRRMPNVRVDLFGNERGRFRPLEIPHPCRAYRAGGHDVGLLPQLRGCALRHRLPQRRPLAKPGDRHYLGGQRQVQRVRLVRFGVRVWSDHARLGHQGRGNV